MTDLKENRPLFDLGLVVATPAALEVCEDANVAPSELLQRHRCGDWGDICKEDCKENNRSLRHGWRILSSYPVGENRQKVWVLTEADRSATTILLPHQY